MVRIPSFFPSKPSTTVTHATAAARSFRTTQVWLAVLVALIACLPTFAFAQSDNPFADSGARSSAVSFLQSMVFWVWIAVGGGFLLYLIAYFGQAIVPSWFSQFRDYIRNGAILVAVFNLVIKFIISQANASPSSFIHPVMGVMHTLASFPIVDLILR